MAARRRLRPVSTDTSGQVALAWLRPGVVGGLPVVAHTYQDAAGHRVVLLVADRPFPMAAGARHDAADTWIAEAGGVVLFCADDPAPPCSWAPTVPGCWGPPTGSA